MPEHVWAHGVLSFYYAMHGQKPESLNLITDAVLSIYRKDASAILFLASIYAMNGETDEALKWLGYCLDIGCINYPFQSRLDPYLESIRGDPRFQNLIERVKYEWEHFEV
jgi:hypothetical protein